MHVCSLLYAFYKRRENYISETVRMQLYGNELQQNGNKYWYNKDNLN